MFKTILVILIIPCIVGGIWAINGIMNHLIGDTHEKRDNDTQD